MIEQMQATVQKLAARASEVRLDIDRMSIQRHAEHIYNVAARNENDLTKQIARQRYPVARNLKRSMMVQERFKWQLLQQHVKSIVELLQAQERDNVAPVLHDEGSPRT